MPDKILKIYAIKDPRSSLVRYVGATSRELSKRLSGHIDEAKRGRKSHKASWIRELLSEDLLPNIEIICTASPENWRELEKFWIDYHIEIGSPLTNLMQGGLGVLSHSEETKQKLSEIARKQWTDGIHRPRPVSDETKAKISKTLTGKRHSAETIAKLKEIAKTKPPQSKESRKKAADALRGRKYSPEHCAAISRGRKGIKHTEEAKAKIKATTNTTEFKEKAGSYRRGTKLTQEHKDKIANKHKGMKRSDEAKNNMREAQKKLRESRNGIPRKRSATSEETKMKISNSLKGKTKSEEHRQKLSQASKSDWIHRKAK